jgi:hypothetical protein
MRRIPYAFIAVLCAAALLAGCNLPFLANSNDTASVQTAAALTVQAQLTPAGFATATFTPVPFPTIPPLATTQVPANTLPPSATATSTCDIAQFITDVTIPDGTVMDPDEGFTKTWRLKNIGACTWSGYNLIFDSGDLMSGTSPIAIGTVAPGQEVDLSVNLTAPSTDGAYRGYWRIRNTNGVLLPIVSGYQAKSFYVDIKVGTGGGPFAVTHVTYTMSTWSDAGHTDCPRVTASISTNAAGTITYHWIRSDGPEGTHTLDFGSATTKTINYDWALGSINAGDTHFVGIFIDSPNHQDFGHQNFTTACTTP